MRNSDKFGRLSNRALLKKVASFSTFAIALSVELRLNMAARNRSERSNEENEFSLENMETVNSDEGYNQEETELSVSLLTEIGTNADQNEIEIIEYNVEIFIALVQKNHVYGTLPSERIGIRQKRKMHGLILLHDLVKTVSHIL